MPADVMIPVSEYLGHTYDPDCEYVDGILLERNAGESGHSDAQTALSVFARTRLLAFWSGVEVRVQVSANRYRVPDVTIVRGRKPAGRIITAPPEVAVEVLSPDDRASDIQDKIDDYLGFGIACVWVIRTDTRRAWIHTNDGSHEAKDGMLRNPAGDIAIPLAVLFRDSP
jgi:Uma2 family endonuclease